MNITCESCGKSIYDGFAKCPECGQIRAGFEAYQPIIQNAQSECVLSGAPTDVRLPNGDWIWAPYILGFFEAGWLTADFQYTEKFFLAHPDWEIGPSPPTNTL